MREYVHSGLLPLAVCFDECRSFIPAYVLVYHFTQEDLDHGDARAVIKSALAA